MIDPSDRLDLRSSDIAGEKRQELLRLFPKIRTEGGKLDFDRLKLALGESVDVGKERYGMNWPGKADCFKTIQKPSLGTLRPCPEESVNFDTTENMIIEGDNLEVLKLLQKSYLGKVKMIYIDPPYNTGNDFIYPDNYSESLQTYLEYTRQVDDEGRKFGTNTDTDGRFHSKWLNMMYPRLYLARNLLREDGVIFISIDDNEVSDLRKLCDEIFGEENLVAQIVWKSRVSEDTRATTGASVDHEYVICYRKNELGAFRGSEKDLSKFSNPDNDPRGPWRSADMTGLLTASLRPNCHYELTNPETGVTYECPPKGWRFDSITMKLKISEKRILWPSTGEGRPRHKLFLNEMKSNFKNLSTVILKPNTINGTKEIESLVGNGVFQFPKPSGLIETFIQQVIEDGDIVLDFFSGSGTTAHAVLSLNKDGGNRKFILVQLPEPIENKEYPTIADVTKERVRRVIKKLNEDGEGKLDLNVVNKQDRGFRVYKLAESNFKTWDSAVAHDALALGEQLDSHVDHIRDGRKPGDLFYEILLKDGIMLTAPVGVMKLEGKTVYNVSNGELFVCLEHGLTLELIRAMAAKAPQKIVCLDEGFAGNDQLKANAVQIFKTKGTISFKTV